MSRLEGSNLTETRQRLIHEMTVFNDETLYLHEQRHIEQLKEMIGAEK